jgi:FixJ family two-component response regulator
MSDVEHIVYVIDDDQSVRAALKRLLLSVSLDAQLFASPQDFMRFERPDVPSCMVLDIRFPFVSGLDLQQQLATQGVDIPIIFLTGYGDIPMTVRAMKAGAVEFLTKPFRDQDLIDSIYRALAQNRTSREARRFVLHLQQRYNSLTAREKDVLPLLVNGLLNKQIAAELGASEKTIKVHRGQLMRKMHAMSVAELVRMAEKLGLIPQGLTSGS